MVLIFSLDLLGYSYLTTLAKIYALKKPIKAISFRSCYVKKIYILFNLDYCFSVPSNRITLHVVFIFSFSGRL